MRRAARTLLRGLGALMLGLTLVACALHVSNSGSDPLTDRPAGALRVATLNVHYIILNQQTGPWSVGDWDRRKGPLDDAFKTLRADIVAFQEMESFQRGSDGSVNLARDWLLSRNPDYAAAASGDWQRFPSTQPIFFRTDRLRLVDQGWFFFSTTPDVIYSRTFDGSYPAFASWALFRPLSGGPDFAVYNVHYEYKSRSNRRLSAELTRDRMRPVIDRGVPVILVGDLNARAGTETVRILESAGLSFADVPGATYHFNRGVNLFSAIDHVAVTPGIRLTGSAQVLRAQFRGEWPADHYPVVVDLFLPAG